MQRTYWQEWDKILKRWGLKPLANVMMANARPLLPLAAQMMVLGLPLLKGFTLGTHYAALIDTLDDEEKIKQFSDYLSEEDG